jgi:hypothetical protein
MTTTLIHYAPLFVAGVALLIVLLVIAGIRREGGRNATWVTTQGRVLAVQKRVGRLDDGQTDAVFHDYYLLRCSYRTADGRELTGWANRRYNRPIGTEGQVLPLWYDPRQPESFTVLSPLSTRRAAVTYGPAVLFAAAAAVVAILFFRAGR